MTEAARPMKATFSRDEIKSLLINAANERVNPPAWGCGTPAPTVDLILDEDGTIRAEVQFYYHIPHWTDIA